MGFIDEFKAFVLRGNLIDMAIGIVIGAAFGKVTGAFVEGVFTPPVGLLTGGVDFSNKFIPLKSTGTNVIVSLADATKANIPVIAWGKFLTACIDFLIVAFAMFLVIKLMNLWKKEAPAPPPAGPTPTEKLLTEIRDALAKK